MALFRHMCMSSRVGCIYTERVESLYVDDGHFDGNSTAHALKTNYANGEYATGAYLVDANRQPGVGWEKTSTPCRRRTRSMASSDCGISVGDLSSRPSQYSAARGVNPASIESCDCVNPASVRAALNCLPDVMFDMTSSADGAGPSEADGACEIYHS